ncbi:exosortase A [Aurantiacibacter aquimixticola]|uniref:Exosortase A n=1 Tax=Aurantiacibacter aquimixticola TaxID=1958945 RepID=A0A419RWP4_9SPHN|nr:exosortase A [Aurantiacibacter aquimixticola]
MAPQWRLPLAQLALAWAALFALLAADWAEMAMQWWDSSTYNHILLVPAILAWLVWQRASELAELTPRAWWPGLTILAAALFVWLLGDLSGLNTATHLGVVGALQASVIAILGPRVAWALLFPLAYALFLVPVGDELVPALQMITADITIALTMASGIPAHIDGVFIDTPAGLFEVAEACSGVKFLIAMIALGTLVAHVCFSSGIRRAAFVALAIVLPIIANGIRAWGTIYIAQSQGIGFAEGFDHIVYGWLFFALVMAILLGIGWRFFDRAVDEPFIDGQALAAASFFGRFERRRPAGWRLPLAIAAMALATVLWAGQARALSADLPVESQLPEVAGWSRAQSISAYPWQPRLSGADRTVRASYRDAEGRTVDVVYALYAVQAEGREAGAFGEGALPPESEWRWLEATAAGDGASGERILALGRHRRASETWFNRGGWTGQSRLRLKLITMRDKLLFRARPTATLILSSPEQEGEDGSVTITDFRQSTMGLEDWMDRASGSL